LGNCFELQGEHLFANGLVASSTRLINKLKLTSVQWDLNLPNPQPCESHPRKSVGRLQTTESQQLTPIIIDQLTKTRRVFFFHVSLSFATTFLDTQLLRLILQTIMSAVPIPFSEPPWLMGLPSAYYNESHKKWQKTCRVLVDKLLMAEGGEWEKAGDVPSKLPFHKPKTKTKRIAADLYQKFVAANFLIPNLSAPLPIKWLHKLGIYELPGGLKVQDFDYLHTLIYVDEMARTGSLGPSGAVTTGIAFGLPPILKFGNQELQERFVPDLMTGRKRICIAITEPEAGSDVSNIVTTAKRSACGKYFIVNGTKKW